jgi:hypothetical protein
MAGVDSKILIQKLDAFIRKYYKNKMLRGALYSVGITVSIYLLIVFLEYLGRFNTNVRAFLFFSLAASILAVIGYYIVLPLTKLFRLGKVISNEEAALIIGQHFPNIQDKLLNTLQLHQAARKENNALLWAAIEQKQAELSPVSFQNAVNFRENTKYLKYALPPLLLLSVLLVATPSTITRPTKRIVQFSKAAEDAPFQFVVTSPLRVTQNHDAVIELELKGNEIPERVYLVKGNQKLLLEKKDLFHHQILFPHVEESFDFYFTAADYNSQPFSLQTIAEPKMLALQATITFPAYLKKSPQVIGQSGDLSVPEGSTIHWNFNSQNADQILLMINQSSQTIPIDNDQAEWETQAMTSFGYQVIPQSSAAPSPDSLAFWVNVIPDQYPSISLLDKMDSTQNNLHTLTGEVQDDYGLSALFFCTKTPGQKWNKQSININTQSTSDIYFLPFDVQSFSLNPGDTLSYYFEVWDNDGIHGAKSSKTLIQKYIVLSDEDMENKSDEQREELIDDLSKAQQESQKIQQALKDLEKKLLEKKEADWQDKKKLDDLLKRQEQLQEKLKELQKENLQHQEEQKNQMELPEELLEKQKKLEELMEQLIDPETKKMMEELRKMMEDVDKNELQKEMDQLQNKEENLEKEIDRALEQLKELEVEQKMEKTIQELQELSEQQKELSKDAEEGKKSTEQLQKEQNELNEKFKDVQDDLKKLEELNQQLENPKDLPNTEEQQKDISDSQQKSSQDLKGGKKSSASKSQSKAAEKMQEMAEKMESSMEQEEEEQQEEDAAALRQLLENLVSLSFSQEKLMNDFSKLNIADPNYDSYGQRQRKINDDMKMVEDSLFALSKRVSELSTFINKEVGDIQNHMGSALKWIPERQIPATRAEQQFVMTGLNNLALMLDESLKQMQQQQQQKKNQKSGNGKCKKPGQSQSGKGKPKPSAGQMKKMQESLSKQLEDLKKQGQNKGQSKTGNNPQLSKELAGAAAKQAALRKMMEDKAAEMNQDGSGKGNEMKQIAKEMEQIQKDIVNNNITEETLRRQKDILTRLLRAENAERTQGEDEKRESKEGQNVPSTPPPGLEEYMKKKTKEAELLQTIPPQLKPYYRSKANQYLMNQIPK